MSLNYQLKEWNDYKDERSLFDKPELFQGEESLAKLKQWIQSGAYIAVEADPAAKQRFLQALIERMQQNRIPLNAPHLTSAFEGDGL